MKVGEGGGGTLKTSERNWGGGVLKKFTVQEGGQENFF